MAYQVRHAAGYLLIAVLIAVLLASMLRSECACTGEGDCFCMQSGEALHDVQEEDLRKIPDPEQSEYRHFLDAWEMEFAARSQEWASLYAEFHAQDRTEDETLEFDRQLARAYRDFLILFRDRHEKYRERLSIEVR